MNTVDSFEVNAIELIKPLFLFHDKSERRLSVELEKGWMISESSSANIFAFDCSNVSPVTVITRSKPVSTCRHRFLPFYHRLLGV